MLRSVLLITSLTACVPLEGSFEGECLDGVDNDGNGSTDCDDLACADDCAETACKPKNEVCINEFMAENDDFLLDEYGDSSDWIELHNPSTKRRSLEGFTITDDFDLPDQASLDRHAIPAGGYLILWASGDPSKGGDHLPFKLSAESDAIGLYCAAGSPAQELEWTEDQGQNVSTGRIPDCEGGMTPGLVPTPWTSNAE